MQSADFETELLQAVRPQSMRDLEEAGVPRSTLRGTKWRSTSRGYYVPAATPMNTTQRILECLPLIPPTGAISGWAAAYVHGVSQLDGLDPRTMRQLPILLNVGNLSGRRPRPGIRFSWDRLGGNEIAVVSGVPVVIAARAALDECRSTPDLWRRIGCIDAMAHAQILGLHDWARYVEAHPRWAGIGRAREALRLADPAARSTWESRLRVLYIVDAGLPQPLVNVPVFDLTGRLLGIPDLLDEKAGLVVEFDGQHHRGRRQHRDDNIREEVFERANLVVVRVDSLDLERDHARTIARLRDGRQRGLRRDRRGDQWTTVEPDWWLEQCVRGAEGPTHVSLTDAEKADLYGST